MVMVLRRRGCYHPFAAAVTSCSDSPYRRRDAACTARPGVTLLQVCSWWWPRANRGEGGSIATHVLEALGGWESLPGEEVSIRRGLSCRLLIAGTMQQMALIAIHPRPRHPHSLRHYSFSPTTTPFALLSLWMLLLLKHSRANLTPLLLFFWGSLFCVDFLFFQHPPVLIFAIFKVYALICMWSKSKLYNIVNW